MEKKNRKQILLAGGMGFLMTLSLMALGYQEPKLAPVRQEQTAWWGALYPENTLPYAMKKVGENGTGQVNVTVTCKLWEILNSREE